MNRFTLACAAFGTAVALHPVGAVEASPATPSSDGTPCHYVGAQQDTVTGQNQEGLLSGGPYAGTGTLSCQIVVNGSAVAEARQSGTAVVAVPPTRVSVWADSTSVPVVCTTWYDASGVYHWDARAQAWSSSSETPCAPLNGNGDAVPPAAGGAPWGSLCDLTADGLGGSERGVLIAGPLVVTRDDGGAASGTVHCTVQVGVRTHTGEDACTAVGTGLGVVVLGPTTCGWAAAADDTVYLCTTVITAGSALYFDDFSGNWTTSPDARCQPATTVVLEAAVKSDERAGSGGAKRERKAKRDKGPSDVDDDGDPDDDNPDTDPVPAYPAGTIEISRSPAGIVTAAFTGFVPEVARWECVSSSGGTVVTCTPPAPDLPSARNVCGRVQVAATSTSPGPVTGVSRCAAGASASAMSSGPATTPTVAQQSPQAAFPWSCSAAPDGNAVAWTVRCSVGP